MSVAFRREGDDEHKEPEFELPIAVGPNLVTPRGLRLLGEEVARLEVEIAATTDADARNKLQRRLRYLRASFTELVAAVRASAPGSAAACAIV